MDPSGTPVLNGYSCEDVPSRTTQSRLLLRKEEIVSSFLEFQFQFKISKVTIIHVFHLKLHQIQTASLHFILAVCHFLKWVTPSRFGFAMQRELKQLKACVCQIFIFS